MSFVKNKLASLSSKETWKFTRFLAIFSLATSFSAGKTGFFPPLTSHVYYIVNFIENVINNPQWSQWPRWIREEAYFIFPASIAIILIIVQLCAKKTQSGRLTMAWASLSVVAWLGEIAKIMRKLFTKHNLTVNFFLPLEPKYTANDSLIATIIGCVLGILLSATIIWGFAELWVAVRTKKYSGKNMRRSLIAFAVLVTIICVLVIAEYINCWTASPDQVRSLSILYSFVDYIGIGSNLSFITVFTALLTIFLHNKTPLESHAASPLSQASQSEGWNYFRFLAIASMAKSSTFSLIIIGFINSAKDYPWSDWGDVGYFLYKIVLLATVFLMCADLFSKKAGIRKTTMLWALSVTFLSLDNLIMPLYFTIHAIPARIKYGLDYWYYTSAEVCFITAIAILVALIVIAAIVYGFVEIARLYKRKNNNEPDIFRAVAAFAIPLIIHQAGGFLSKFEYIVGMMFHETVLINSHLYKYGHLFIYNLRTNSSSGDISDMAIFLVLLCIALRNRQHTPESDSSQTQEQPLNIE